jgi:nitroreductase
MEVLEAIDGRHSYRGPYVDQPVPHEDLVKIMEAGLKAPSGCNAQTTRFVIVEDPELLRQIGELPSINNTAMRQAKAMIACIIDRDPPPVSAGLSFQVEDCSAAVENMLLAITGLGYASVWMDGWLRAKGSEDREVINRLLAVPEEKTVRVILPVGVPEEEVRERQKKPFEERAWFNRYGGSEE